VAILVSRYDHCLMDLLWRWETGELDAEIPLVVSNHPDLAARVEAYDIPFHHLPLLKETKAEQESKILDLLAELDVDSVVLARYMQVLTPVFVNPTRTGSSTSTTRSCRPSQGPTPTGGCTRGA
jgi:formyltetrahydrofolate deformylase